MTQRKPEQTQLFSGVRTWSIPDLWKEIGRLRREAFFKQAAYERKQSQSDLVRLETAGVSTTPADASGNLSTLPAQGGQEISSAGDRQSDHEVGKRGDGSSADLR
jgi:hypothetical protein